METLDQRINLGKVGSNGSVRRPVQMRESHGSLSQVVYNKTAQNETVLM